MELLFLSANCSKKKKKKKKKRQNKTKTEFQLTVNIFSPEFSTYAKENKKNPKNYQNTHKNEIENKFVLPPVTTRCNAEIRGDKSGDAR